MKTLDSFAPPPVRGLVDDEEMADITRLSVAAINKLRQDGLIPYLRIGNRVRFDPAAVLAALGARYTVREQQKGGKAQG